MKYFKNNILKNHEISEFELEKELQKSEIKYTFWEISRYNPEDKKENEHKFKRMEVQAIEHNIIYKLQDKAGLNILNRRVNDPISKSKKSFFEEDARKVLLNKANNILKELGYE